MLIPQSATCEPNRWQGRHRSDFAELRRQLAEPSAVSDGNRQRLRDLSQRLARVQALGDEYARVALSPQAQVACRAAHGA